LTGWSPYLMTRPLPSGWDRRKKTPPYPPPCYLALQPSAPEPKPPPEANALLIITIIASGSVAGWGCFPMLCRYQVAGRTPVEGVGLAGRTGMLKRYRSFDLQEDGRLCTSLMQFTFCIKIPYYWGQILGWIGKVSG